MESQALFWQPENEFKNVEILDKIKPDFECCTSPKDRKTRHVHIHINDVLPCHMTENTQLII